MWRVACVVWRNYQHKNGIVPFGDRLLQWDYQFLPHANARRTGTATYNKVKKGFNVYVTLTFLLISALQGNILYECQNPLQVLLGTRGLTKPTTGHNI